ncbi:ATP/GTP-binding protein [Chloroflexota bacterium]
MYRQIKIENFRCFGLFSIDGCERINLISGNNNIGKTTLLEAIWLHHGSPIPDLGIRLNSFRGLSGTDAMKPLSELFKNLDTDKTISILSVDDKERSRKTTLYLRETTIIPLDDEGYLPDERTSPMSGEFMGKEVVIECVDEEGVESRAIAYFTPTGVKFDKAFRKQKTTARFLSSRRVFGNEYIELFSQLEAAKKKNEIIRILRLLEPRLKDITVIVRGGIPYIWGDIGSSTLLPLQLMGDGFARWLLFILSLLNCRDGIVLVDEIENGIYHSALDPMWQSLSEIARDYNVQIFATTHSAECVRAAHKAFSDSNLYDFKLYRLENINNQIESISYTKKMLDVAIDSGLEFR